MKGSESAIKVTENLYHALDHIRSETEVRVMWIDALCIDQTNISERNQQVRLMRRIYSLAAEVLVWLGPTKNASDVAMQQFEELSKLDWLEILNWDDYNFQAITTLMERSWFERVWIRQEIKSSRVGACTVRCGDAFFPLPTLEYFHDRLGDFVGLADRPKYDELSGRWSGLSHALEICATLDMCLPSEETELLIDDDKLLVWLWASTFAKATDPRDHIFAILGLTDSATETEYLVDYSKSATEIFASTVSFYLHKNQNLDILLLHKNCRTDPKLPSWVPDWSCPSDKTFSILNRKRYQASRGSAVDYKLDKDLWQLSLKGLQISKVKSVYESKQDTQIFKAASSDALCVRRYGKGYSMANVVWRTLVADVERPGNKGRDESRRWPKDDNDWMFRLQRLQAGKDESSHDEIRELEGKLENWKFSTRFMERRRIILSSHGHLGMAPETSAEGDLICKFAGATMPFLIRPKLGTEHYLYIGEAYVHGIMDGEAWNEKTLEYFTLD